MGLTLLFQAAWIFPLQKKQDCCLKCSIQEKHCRLQNPAHGLPILHGFLKGNFIYMPALFSLPVRVFPLVLILPFLKHLPGEKIFIVIWALP
jgi:hypothetical protein